MTRNDEVGSGGGPLQSFANIQGLRGKKESLKNVMSTTGADIVMLAETMARNISVEGCQCINPKLSVGQNVS